MNSNWSVAFALKMSITDKDKPQTEQVAE